LDYNPETGEFFWREKGNGRNLGVPAGGVYAERYLGISIDRRVYYSHRLAWLYVHGYFPENQISHINRDKLDNRIENLRWDTHANNNLDRKKHGKYPTGKDHPMYGRKMSEEHKAKIGLKSKGRKMSEESKIKIGDSNRGREKSPETRAKISEKNKGRKISNELKEYFSVKYAGENNPYYGRKHSPEVIEKMCGENHHKSMWWKITFEDGSVIEKCGLTTWAKENKYNCSAIRRLASKKIKRYKNVVSIEKLSQHK
jgi:hypothetical protein